MFRTQLIRSVVAAGRVLSRPAVISRPLSFSALRAVGACNYSSARFGPFMTQRRFASDAQSSAADIKKRIEACTFNDAAKEKIISEEAKKHNFEALRILGDELVVKAETKELGILCYVQAADQGDVLSQFAVGNLYMQRYFQEKMKPDYDAKLLDNFMEKSHMWYSMAAEKGHVPSKVGNAKMYLEDPTRDNVKLAMQIYEEADQAGNVDATYNLGFIYYEGLYNIPKDRPLGYSYLRKAADMGDVNACFFIGFSFHKGLHENDNPNAAVPTTSKPGEGGTELCAKDISQCLAYLERAATGGHSKALLYLHQMYKNADGVEKDLTKSKDYLIKAMRLGDPEAMFIRGNQFYAGEDGEEVNKEKALKMFLDAGARGNADAMCSAGAMIYNGEGQERDLKKAFEVYTNAASLGSLPALKNVGVKVIDIYLMNYFY